MAVGFAQNDLVGIAKNLQKHHTLKEAAVPSPWPVDVVWLWCGFPETACAYTEDLRYSIRSVSTNMPWIRRLVLVVNDDFEPPFWMRRDIDRNKCMIVRLHTFIPARYLPNRNYHTLQSWLHRINSLSEHFIFLHDDMYVARPTPWTCFFARDGTPINRHYAGGPDHGIYPDHRIPYVRMWNAAIQKYNIHNTRIQQQALPYRKADLQKYYKQYEAIINKTSRTRHITGQNDFDLLKFTTALTTTNKEAIGLRTDPYEWQAIKPGPVIDYFTESDDKEGIKNIRKVKPRFFISNNSGSIYSHLYDFLRSYFSKPSPIEATL